MLLTCKDCFCVSAKGIFNIKLLGGQCQIDHIFIIDHYIDVTMTTIASQITSHAIVYSIVYSGIDQRKHQSSASLAFVRGIHRGPVNSPHKGPVPRKMFPFDDVIIDDPWLSWNSGYSVFRYLASCFNWAEREHDNVIADVISVTENATNEINDSPW